MKGAKLVLFITGKCAKDCFYCPISEERVNKDGIFANEIKVDDIEQALTEARLIKATGMGITGGEPLLQLNRTIKFIRTFKDAFGEKFHIHLYTGLEPVPIEAVKQLLKAGLDELRLHRFEIGVDYKQLRHLLKGKVRLGIEIPIIPSMMEQLKELFQQAEDFGIDFINLNEMEFTTLNAQQLRERGYELEIDSIASVQKSEDEAIELIEWAAAHTSLNIHFCPLSLKDGTQLRNRFKRRAQSIAKPFERISKEGLLVKAIITTSPDVNLTDLQNVLIEKYRIQADQIRVNETKNRIETSTRLARRLASRLKAQGLTVGIIEEYPIASRFQVSYSPL